MSINPPEVIEEKNLSLAWGRALHHVLNRSKAKLAPAIVSIVDIGNGIPKEDRAIRRALDDFLGQFENKQCTKNTAMTIFPWDAWERQGRPSVEEFSDWYLKHFFPRIKARDRLNKRGTYFERMLNFRGAAGQNDRLALCSKNQLLHLVNIWKRDREKGSSPRHSALQVSIFDPAKDHTGSKLLGFPCLQQISFAYDHENRLSINAFYPTQYIVDRGYGNYLGLCHLGLFIAQNIGLSFERLNCFIGHPDLGSSVSKGSLGELSGIIKSRLQRDIERS